MVKRYKPSEMLCKGGAHIVVEDNKEYVALKDYALLQADNERYKEVLEKIGRVQNTTVEYLKGIAKQALEE